MYLGTVHVVFIRPIKKVNSSRPFQACKKISCTVVCWARARRILIPGWPGDMPAARAGQKVQQHRAQNTLASEVERAVGCWVQHGRRAIARERATVHVVHVDMVPAPQDVSEPQITTPSKKNGQVEATHKSCFLGFGKQSWPGAESHQSCMVGFRAGSALK